MVQPDLYGLVLAGGSSSRMGRDKSLIAYHNGVEQRRHLVNLLRHCCEQVFISLRTDLQHETDLSFITDQFQFKSPMNGVLSALKTHPDVAWLVVAVDMPFIDQAAIETLISKRNKDKVATCYLNVSENFPEPLFTIWEPKAFPQLLDFVDQGRMSPRDFLANANVELVIPADLRIFHNVNHPNEIP